MDHPLFVAVQKALADCDEHSAMHNGLCNNALYDVMGKAYNAWTKAGKPVTLKEGADT